MCVLLHGLAGYWLSANWIRIRTVQLERTCKDHQVQMPDLFRTKQNLKHDIEGIIQMPGLVSDHLPGQEIFPGAQSDPSQV